MQLLGLLIPGAGYVWVPQTIVWVIVLWPHHSGITIQSYCLIPPILGSHLMTPENMLSAFHPFNRNHSLPSNWQPKTLPTNDPQRFVGINYPVILRILGF